MVTKARKWLLGAALPVAYGYVATFRFFHVISVPFGTDPYYVEPWYWGPAAHMIPPFAACMIVGWMSGWARGLAHGIGMGAATVLAYALIDLVEQPATHGDAVTIQTAPWYLAGLTGFYLSGTLMGCLLRFLWRKFAGHAPSPSTANE